MFKDSRLGLLLALLCAGCGTPAFLSDLSSSDTYGPYFENTNIFGEGKYMTFEHPFTDAAAERAQKNALRYCAQARLVAVKTRNTCSLERCNTTFQCMKPEEAADFQTPRK